MLSQMIAVTEGLVEGAFHVDHDQDEDLRSLASESSEAAEFDDALDEKAFLTPDTLVDGATEAAGGAAGRSDGILHRSISASKACMEEHVSCFRLRSDHCCGRGCSG